MANAEIVTEWVAALRSGEYQQATRVLTRIGEDGEVIGHCCLGVLCDLAAKKGLIDSKDVGEFRVYGTTDVQGRGGEYLMPPQVIRDWIGVQDNFLVDMDHSDGIDPDALDYSLKRDAYFTGLASLNDAEKWSFEKIADKIEKAYL